MLEGRRQTSVPELMSRAPLVPAVVGPEVVGGPRSLLEQRVELLVMQDVRGEPVGVRRGLPLGGSEQVDLAKRLLEGLPQVVLQQPPAPGVDLIG